MTLDPKPYLKNIYLQQLDEAFQMFHFLGVSGAPVLFQQAMHKQDNADRYNTLILTNISKRKPSIIHKQI